MNVELDVSLLYRIVGSLIILVAIFVIGKLTERLLRSGARKSGVPEVEAVLLCTLVKYVIYLFGIMEALTYAGITLLPFLFAITLIAVVVGISSHSLLRSVISGYVLRVYEPFSVGDTIRIESVTGKVTDIDLLNTTIETDLHQYKSVPNSRIMDSEIFNYTRHGSSYCVELEVTLPLEIETKEMKISILEMLEGLANLSKNMPVMITSKELTRNGILVKVRFYVPEHRMIEGSRDYLINKIADMIRAKDRVFKGESVGTTTPNYFEPDNRGKPEQVVPECEMCSSHRWAGYLKCDKCSGYYLYGKCVDCDELRIKECVLDGEKLEFMNSRKSVKKEK